LGFRLVTLNLNGIRSAATKGFETWADQAQIDCMGVQEVKAQMDVIEGRFDRVAGLSGFFHCAQKKGYSGVGLYTRQAPSAVITGFDGGEFDDEGRYLEARFDTARRKFSVISCYFPSGSSGDDRQAAKYRFLAAVHPHLMRLKAERDFVLVGDINIAHQPIDLKNWRSNQKNSGFLPEERAWLDNLFGGDGLVDVFRRLNQQPEQYTWWSNRGQAWAKNVGWRLDYHIATPALADKAHQAAIYTAQRFSDHAPLTIDYDFTL
jgi:exodeoxyribonuclease-3